MATTKTIEYLVKDFDSSVDAMINFATINYGTGTEANRLWTDFNQASFSRTWLELVAFMSDIFFFYFDNQATQSYLQTATVRSAVIDIAKQFGFTPSSKQSASGVASFDFTGPGTLPRGTRVQSLNGTEFYLTAGIVASIPGTYTGTVLQGTIVSETLTAQGLQNEEFNLIGPNVVRDTDNSNPLDVSPQVYVNGNLYTLVDTFILSNGTDTPAITDSLGNVIGGGGRVYTISERPTGTPYIRFGDGIFGRKLLSGEVISVVYRSGGGSIGNIPKQTLTNILDTVPFVSGVDNTSDFSGGAEEQSIEQLRQLIPANLRTMERAVSAEDYADLILAKFPEIQAAAAEKNEIDAGIDINIYLVPNGIGIPKISENATLKSNISSFVERRKMVTIAFQIQDAFAVDTLFNLKVYITTTASKSTVQAAIIELFENYFNLSSGGPEGAGLDFGQDILSEDLQRLLKEIPGVERFEFTRHTYRPRIEERVLGLTTSYASSNVEIYPNITQAEWLIGAAGPVTRPLGEYVFENAQSSGFTYEADTGAVTYTVPVSVDLSNVAVGDTFIAGEGIEETTSIQTRGDLAGVAEVSKVITVADEQGYSETTKITGSLTGSAYAGKYFILQDTNGSVAVWFSVGGSTEPSHGALRSISVTLLAADTDAQVATKLAAALNSDLAFTASVSTNEVTVSLDIPFTVSDVADGEGLAATGFTFAILQKGQSAKTLKDKYFDIYDENGPVRCWYQISGSAGPATPAGGRRITIPITANASANAVATATQTALDLDSKFSATANLNQVLITDTSVTIGSRTNISSGNSGFTTSVITQGAAANSLSGTYFDIQDAGLAQVTAITCLPASSITGGQYFLINSAKNQLEYYVWYKKALTDSDPNVTDKLGILVQINSTDNAIEVAKATALALSATSNFSIPEPSSAIMTVTNTQVGHVTAAVNGNMVTPFTFTVLQAGRDQDVRVWFNTGSSPVPAIPSSGFGRLLEVAILAGDDANTVAQKLKTIINNDLFFNASVTDNVVTVLDTSVGFRENAIDYNTGFTLETTQQGIDDNQTFSILGVDNLIKKLYILPNQLVSTLNPAPQLGGSIQSFETSYESYKVFKKLNAVATNLSVDSITDNNLDLSIFRGNAATLDAVTLLDNQNVFKEGQYSTGDYFLVDSASNIWEIQANSSNTITTFPTATNDASIIQVAPGDYQIVQKLTSYQVLFNGSIFGIQFNNDKTFFSIGAQFINIGTIGDDFQVAKTQANIGNLGMAVDIIQYDSANSTVLLNGAPDLAGLFSNYELIDSTGQLFNVVGIDNRSLPATYYPTTEQDFSMILSGVGVDQRLAQGFKVPITTVYSVVSFNLKRSGNVAGNLSVSILQDNGLGFPDLSSPPIAISNSVNVGTVSQLNYYNSFDDSVFMPNGSAYFDKIAFTFDNPPTLTTDTQYHLVLRGDTTYANSQANGSKVFDNSAAVAFTEQALSEEQRTIAYSTSVNLSNVLPGNYFRDGEGKLYLITAVDDTLNTITIVSNIAVSTTPGVDSGTIYKKDNIYLAIDQGSATYADGQVTTYNGTLWAVLSTPADSIFSVEGPKSIKINSNLTPALGPGATIAKRYYDDNQELSFVLGLAGGLITSAPDVNANGTGTISSVSGKKVDTFVFRTSPYNDDITNLRTNEIPQFLSSNLNLSIFGGVS